MRRWLAIVGIGEDGLAGLNPTALALIETAEVLVGGARHLAMVPGGTAERIVWDRPLSATLEAIERRRGRRVTVLASGDPMWYGVGVTLSRRFAPEEMAIIPQPSAFSLAAARLGWPLADCATITLHGRPLETLRLHLAPHRLILALSEDGNTPRAVAELLTTCGWGRSRLSVFAHLGGSRECVVEEDAQAWSARRVPDLNTLAIECRPGSEARALSLLAGLPDDAFEHDGQLTKREVRAATLAALNPLPGQTLWDVGAGCGSVAIEWLRGGGRTAIAIEREPARATMIARNAASLGVPALRVVVGTAPAALTGLPHADAIFIGGAIASPGLLEEAWEHLPPGGRLAANAVTPQGEARLLDWHARHGGTLIRIAVSRVEPVGPQQLWRPLAPVTQLSVQKPC